MEDLVLIPLDDFDLYRTIQIRSSLTPPLKDKMIDLLRWYADVFAWSHEDMSNIDPKIIVHRLNVDPSHRPILQKRRALGPEQYAVIGEEVNKLLKAGFIEEVYYPDWITNIVLVKKSNEK